MNFFSVIVSSCIFFMLSLPVVWADETHLVICGTGDSQELLRHLASEFSSQHPDISVEIPDSIGSSGGVKSTVMGKCDLGRMARTLKKRELKHKLSYRIFAYSPVVFFTHESVTEVKQLTAEQAAAIFSGTLTNWKDLGGTEGQIYVAHREKGDSSRRILEQHIPAFAAMKQQAGVTFYSTQEIVETVSTHPDTIGYTALSAVKSNSRVNTLVFSGIKPGDDKISGKSYPLLSPFGLVWRSNPPPATEKLLHFLTTPIAHAIIKGYGAIPPVAEVAK